MAPSFAAAAGSNNGDIMSEQEVQRVTATPAAIDLIEKLKAEHGEVLFHQSGGCCDGSAPMCFPVSEFMVGGSDVKLGAISVVFRCGRVRPRRACVGRVEGRKPWAR